MCARCASEMTRAGYPDWFVNLVYPSDGDEPVEAVKPAEDNDYFKRVEAAKLASTLPNKDAGEFIRRADGIYKWLTKGEKSNDDA